MGTPLLIAVGGPGAGRQFSVYSDETVIGRSSKVPICLEGSNISRHHARILRRNGDFFVEDLQSSNGTYLNDRRISQITPIACNDLLRIGNHVFRFEPQTENDCDVTIQSRTAALPGNSALYGEKSSFKLRAVLQLAHDLGSGLDMDVLLNRFFDQLLKLFPRIDRVTVFFFQDGEPVVRFSREEPGIRYPHRFSRSVLAQIVDNQAVLAANTGTLSPNNTLVVMGVRSLLCVPLQAYGVPVFGGVQLERFRMADSLTQDDLHLLTAITLQLAMALEKSLTHEKLIHQEQVVRELALAREIQQTFLPTELPVLRGFQLDIAADLSPAHEVSGDFYDYAALNDHTVFLAVADVSGKGMPAALFMSMVRALLRQIAKNSLSPAEILRQLNQAVARENPKLMFVTMVVAVYDVVSGECLLARAGHPAPIIHASDGSANEITCPAGCLIGIVEDGTRFDEVKLSLSAGDTLMLYTDGITEAVSHGSAEMFGTERLLSTVRNIPLSSGLREYITGLRFEIDRFCAPSHAQDDLTLLLVRHSPAPASPC